MVNRESESVDVVPDVEFEQGRFRNGGTLVAKNGINVGNSDRIELIGKDILDGFDSLDVIRLQSSCEGEN